MQTENIKSEDESKNKMGELDDKKDIKAKTITFDEIDNFEQDASFLITGKRRSGKSVLILNLLHLLTNKYQYDFIMLISDTAKDNKKCVFKELIDKSMIFTSEQMDDKINKVLKYQDSNIKKDKDIYGIIILDDINLTKISQGSLQKCFSLGRHKNLCIILSCQYPKKVVDNVIRSNSDVILCSKLNMAGIDSIFECINCPISRTKFYKFVNKNTKNHHFIMYNSFDEDDDIKIIKGEMIKLVKKKK